MPEIHPLVFLVLGISSVVMFVGSLLIMPAIVIRIPADYFNHEARPASSLARRHPVLRPLLRVVKNGLGLILILAGIAMLALPGQGILTIVVGVFLLDFPRKYQLFQWALRRGLHRPVNWLRRRHHRPPLQIHEPGRKA